MAERKVKCSLCAGMSWILVYDEELDTYHLRCRACGATGPLVSLEA